MQQSPVQQSNWAAEYDSTMTISITGLLGIPEISTGDDLALVISNLDFEFQSGDILVITSKIVSKSEGRLIAADDRKAATRNESKRILAQRGETVISETHHGFVMAAAGVDMSDVPAGFVALLPENPDESARRIKTYFQSNLGINLGVVITDTFGRAWRDGLIDLAIGVAGLPPLIDHRGRIDQAGHTLEASITALVDEIASASELVRTKLSRVPAAVIRGLSDFVSTEHGVGIKPLLRSPQTDWFRYGHRELITSRRTVRKFTNEPVPQHILSLATAAGITAPAPHSSHPYRFIHLVETRFEVLSKLREAWASDLHASGFNDEEIAKRLLRGEILFSAPEVILPFVVLDQAHQYPDHRAEYERNMFITAGGGAVQNFMLALHGEGVGSAWISSTIFSPEVIREALDLPATWEPLGAIACGYAAGSPPERKAPIIDDYLIKR